MFRQRGTVGSNPTLSAAIKSSRCCDRHRRLTYVPNILMNRFKSWTIALFLFPFSLSAQAKIVEVIKIDGSINPATADYIRSGIERASENRAQCLVIMLNTPGGGLKSTRVIVTDILTSPVPVIVYVAPSGSHSASAGVFITLAGHIAAMAPGTNMGAVHPVFMGGQQDSVMMEKATNDAAAFIRTIAEKRSRNVQWAEKSVRQSLSITETEALSEGVIDLVAKNLDSLLIKIDGITIETEEGTVKLSTVGAEIRLKEMSWTERLLDLLSNPDVAYILLMFGIYGILFELYNPSSIFPGVVGVICLILAFYSLHTLPINYAGLALIIFAVILFILEVNIVSHGLLSIAGIICLLLGSIMLVQSDSALEVVRISWAVIIPTVLFTTLFFLFAIGMGIRAQRQKTTTGVEGLVGELGETITVLNPEGEIRLHGEIWHAVNTEGKITKGSKVRVLRVEHLRAVVARVTAE